MYGRCYFAKIVGARSSRPSIQKTKMQREYFKNYSDLVTAENKMLRELNQITVNLTKIIKIKENKGEQNPIFLQKILQKILQTKDKIENLLSESKSSAKEINEINVYKTKFLKTIDDLILDELWQNSAFLAALKNKLQDLQRQIQKDLAEEIIIKPTKTISKASEVLQSSQKKFASGFVQVYILLYQYEGSKIANWEHALRAIAKHNVNRPTYREEQFVQEIIRSKTDPERYGYAIVNIKEDDILPQETKKFDIFNRELLILKENAIKNYNITGFVHANKKCYSFEDNILTYYGDFT